MKRKDSQVLNWIKASLLNSALLVIYLLMTPRILYRKLVHGRPLGNFRQRFLGLVPCLKKDSANGPRLWLHAVSVGEVNLLAPVIEQLQARCPNCQIAISTTTATGMQLAQQKYSQHSIFYFPIDFSWAMKNALRRINPDVLVLTELEIWPNLIRAATDHQIPVVIFNGRLSESSFRGYQRLRWLVGPTFERVSLVTAQSEDDAVRFRAMGCPRVHAVGSIKFDNAGSVVDPALLERLRHSIDWQPDDVLFVAGSTQLPEESYAAQAWKDLRVEFPELRLVIVPRHPHNGPTIQGELADLEVESQLRSTNPDAVVARDQVLIADTIGELTGWWDLASIAFVGGSFGKRGGQNMIEPAASGAAVCFGPNTKNFQRVVELMLRQEVASVINSQEELAAFVRRCLCNPAWSKRVAAAAQAFVGQQQGAIDRTMALWQEHLISEFEQIKAREIKNVA